MKDAYSFHSNAASLQETYDLMYQTYSTILPAPGLVFALCWPTLAASAAVFPMNFMYWPIPVKMPSSSPARVTTPPILKKPALAPSEAATTLARGNGRTGHPRRAHIAELCDFMGTSADKTLKALIVSAEDEEGKTQLYGLMMRGDHELNEVKAQHALGLAN